MFLWISIKEQLTVHNGLPVCGFGFWISKKPASGMIKPDLVKPGPFTIVHI